MKKKRIIVVDDEANIRETLKDILTDEGYEVLTAVDGESALRLVQSEAPDLVLQDIWIPGIDGIQTLKLLKNADPDIEVVMMSGHGAIDTAVKATKFGAFDFIEKPFSMDHLLRTVAKALKSRKGRLARRRSVGFTPGSAADRRFLGASRAAKRLQRSIVTAAEKSRPVLLAGEEGLGKRYAARMIHNLSDRRDHPFIEINCAELDEIQFERTLSAAALPARSRFALAEGGTLFFDSLHKLAPALQPRLAETLAAHFAQEDADGDDVRIVVSFIDPTGKGLDERLFTLLDETGELIRMVPLRRRKTDIPAFVERFVDLFADEYGKHIEKIDPQVFDTLSELPWPGNIGQLQGAVEGAVQRCEEGELTLTSFDLISLSDPTPGAQPRRLSAVAGEPTQEAGPSLRQKTLKTSLVLCGQGLHSGTRTGLILSPLPPDAGVVFADITTGARVPARIEYVRSTEYATTLSNGHVTIKTIEHIMSALSSYQVSNVLIKIGDEAPIMDGSALDFCSLIEDAGLEEQDALVEPIRLTETIVVGDPAAGPALVAEPADAFSVDYTLEYPAPIGRQEHTYAFDTPTTYKEEIAPARTFGFLDDIKALNEAGLAAGGKLSNFVLIGADRVLNTPLRYPNEPCRHKILDLIGDLYLLGRPVLAKFTAIRSGHTQNIQMVKRITMALERPEPIRAAAGGR
ncbi:MAG: UDP-3-O-[3-hydroxymyristoyl] N-acetylglucosamine deacetylase [Nitrospinae bacterium]|nr:UDP-3-O-[3-hydroxymyristoyl] N-acetylglucosamine deacetylase [Nitrospinota bacterium]